MKSLYLRIYLTVVVALALFALVSGWLVQRHLDQQRLRSEGVAQERAEGVARERAEAWGELLQRALPPASVSTAEQAAGLRDWSQRLRLPMALDDTQGQRIAASESFLRRELNSAEMAARLRPIRLDDGRTLWVPRANPARMGGPNRPPEMGPPWFRGGPKSWPEGAGLAALLVVLFAAVALGAWPVVRRLTRRLEALKQGVEAFGAGALDQRVAEDGQDEVAAVGASFNRAAGRIEALLRSHQSLLANASHELRSPLARLKMAVAMMEDAAEPQRVALRQEINTNIAELDALVEEVLLASRLDASHQVDLQHRVSLLAVAAEEAARVGAQVEGQDVQVNGDERLLRRAVRNLLENAQRYGGQQIDVELQALGGRVSLRVCDRGAGVPPSYQERIFEPFFRLPGHAEKAGGVGLGLALVRQIAQRHGGDVSCQAREGGGSCFVINLPAA